MIEQDPFEVLGLSPDASAEEIRRAWLSAVKTHPPDRDPEEFQRLWGAYELVKDPALRLEHRLFGRPEIRDLHDLARMLGARRRRVGPVPWRDALRESGG
jgi:curved DNA-binding protein CbpA